MKVIITGHLMGFKLGGVSFRHIGWVTPHTANDSKYTENKS